MTQQEFKERCHVAVSAEEFEDINAVYMASEVDKDTFCYYWRRMNSRRVEAAEEAEQEARKAMREKDRAFGVYMWLKGAWNTNKTVHEAVCTVRDYDWLKEHGYDFSADAMHVAYLISQKYGF